MDSDALYLSYIAFFALAPFVIFLILAVHEAGHYCAARILGVPVESVVIGSGREIKAGIDKRGTRWSLRLYPVWAHVQLSNFTSGAQALWKQIIIILAGPFFNLALPFVMLLAFFIAVGQPSTPATLTAIEIGQPADKAGLEPGDEVIAVDGKPVYRQKDIKLTGYEPDHIFKYTIRRNGQLKDLTITPTYIDYKDVDGIQRRHARLGVQWKHKPIVLKHIPKVAGQDTKNDIKKTRDLIVRNFDRPLIVGLDSTDGKIHDYKTFIKSSVNPDINNPDHEDYEFVYLGKMRDDFYYRGGVLSAVSDAAAINLEMIREIAALPFQLLPIDPESLRPESAVRSPETWLANKAFSLIYITALGSVLLALINLLPLPRFDGGVLVVYTVEGITGNSLSRRKKTLTLAISFFIFYCAVLISNVDNVSFYMDSRLHKLQDFLNDKD